MKGSNLSLPSFVRKNRVIDTVVANKSDFISYIWDSKF